MNRCNSAEDMPIDMRCQCPLERAEGNMIIVVRHEPDISIRDGIIDKDERIR